MKAHIIITFIPVIVSFIIATSLNSQTIDYLGQDPPGYFPELFADGILTNNGSEYVASFSPDSNEVYYSLAVDGYTIYYMKKEGDVWSDKGEVSFCIPGSAIQDASPCFSPDGKKLFFCSNRSGGFGDYDLWYVERTTAGWSSPVNLGEPVNSASREDYPFVAEDSTLYFNSGRPGTLGFTDIYYAEYDGGGYPVVDRLPDSVNTDDWDECPVIIEDKLFFGCHNQKALAVCYSMGQNQWSKPQIISGGTFKKGYFCGLRLSPDKKYFIYSHSPSGSGNAFNFYWVDIEALNYLGTKEAPFNYIESWYGGVEEQMELALHPQLAKRRVVSADGANEVSYSWMLNAAKTCAGCISNPKEGVIEIQVLHQEGDIASIKAVSNVYSDYLHLAKSGGQWKIINVLWNNTTATNAGSVAEAEQAASDYITGWNTGNVEMMEGVLHTKFVGRKALSVTEVEHINFDWMIDQTQQCKGCDATFDKQIEILDLNLDMASVLIHNSDSVEYLHLAYIDGQYRIVNSLRNYNLGSISAMSENKTNNLIEIYPNPASEIISLNTNTLDIRNITWELMDLTGKTIYKDKLNTNQIDITGIAQGTYLIKLTSADVFVVKKIIII